MRPHFLVYTPLRAGLGHTQSKLLGLNLVFRALTSAATSRWCIGAGARRLIPATAGRRLSAEIAALE